MSPQQATWCSARRFGNRWKLGGAVLVVSSYVSDEVDPMIANTFDGTWQ